MKMRFQVAHELQGALLIACAAMFWGTTGVVARMLYADSSLHPLGLALLRLVIAFPCFLLLSYWRGEHKQVRAHQGHRRWLLLLGMTQGGYQMAYLAAVKWVGAGVATLIALCLPPVVVAILAVPLFKERLTRSTIIALGAAIAGTTMLALEHGIHPMGDWLLGLGMAALSAVIYAGFTLTSRYTAAVFAPFQAAFYCFFIGALEVLPIAYATGNLDGLTTLSAKDWLMVLYVGLIPTCLSYVCFFQGMRTTTATLSSIIVTLEPLFAAILAWVVLGESMTVVGIMGALILTGAVIVAVTPRRPSHSTSS